MTLVPSNTDSLGQVIDPEMSILGIDYFKLIPLLIGAVKQQGGQLASYELIHSQLTDQITALEEELSLQTSRLDQLEHLLALCCQAPPSDVEPKNSIINDGSGLNDERILRIQPNPFTDHTTLYYQLERGGRVQLMANSSDGKQLRVLQEAQLQAGQYQYEWHTTSLAPGIYYVTLLLEGEPLVKRAVKVR